MSSFVSGTLAVNLPSGSAHPVLSGPAVAGDLIEMQAEVYTPGGAGTGFFVMPGPLANGQIVVVGAIPPGTYELRDVRIKDNAGDGQFDAPGVVELIIPVVPINITGQTVDQVSASGGVLAAQVDINSRLYYALAPTGTTYADAAEIKSAAGALVSGSADVLAGTQTNLLPVNTLDPATDYVAFFYAERDAFVSDIEQVPFTTAAAPEAPQQQGFASISLSAGGATNTRLSGSLTSSGDVHSLTLPATDAAPDVATIKATGTGSTGVETFSNAITGLAADQNYITYTVATIDGVDSPIDVRGFNTNAATAISGRRGRRVNIGR